MTALYEETESAMPENHPASNGSGAPSLGTDPFGEVQDLIQAAISRETVQRPQPTEKAPPGQMGQPLPGSRPHDEEQAHIGKQRRKPSSMACPYLGVFEDPNTRFMQPDPAHCCFGTRRPTAVEVDHQTESCLNAMHIFCESYAEGQKRDAGGKEGEKGRQGLFARLFRRG
jgi:hypothetical protein